MIQTVQLISPKREKDDVFWAELEIRRLGNVIAECINARRYIGDEGDAETERIQMRKYIEAMKRKSTRVLHRAELYAESGHAAWPGIDSTITDPVSLAEEYVRVVENYEAVLSEEENRARAVLAETASGGKSDEVIKQVSGKDDVWLLEDDSAYKQAIRRERQDEESAAENRKDLIGDAEGLRRRKGGNAAGKEGELSKEEKELMARHQPVEDELTSNLVELVGQLKENIISNSETLKKDSKILDETEEAVDKNIVGIDKQRENLRTYSQSSTFSWWIMMVSVVVLLIVFVLVLILLKIPL